MQLQVDVAQRRGKQRAHTATHMLHFLLDQMLKGTKQAGSLVDTDYLRFDFAAKDALTAEQLAQLEVNLNERIAADSNIETKEMSLEEAKKLGAKAFFEDKYGDIVRVVQIATPDGNEFLGASSSEFCGGTHVTSTGMVGAFKITTQEAVASGIRRIEAVTGPAVALFAYEQIARLEALAAQLDCQPKQVEEKVQKLLSELKDMNQQIEQISAQLVGQTLSAIGKSSHEDLTYVLNIDGTPVAQIDRKQLITIMKTHGAQENRLVYSAAGQFALHAGKTKNAKELQKKYALQGGGDEITIQGKDTEIEKKLGI